jgi:hypothetical protein
MLPTKTHTTLMRFRAALLDAIKWPHAPSETQAAYRTLWVLLLWWRERPDALRGAFNVAFTRMYAEDKSRVWHAIKVDEWLRMLLDEEPARFGYELDKEERHPTRVKLAPSFPPTATPVVRVQLDALYQARQVLVGSLPEPWLPERFAGAYDPEELVTLHAMLQCPLVSLEWMTSESILGVVGLFASAEEKRAFWVQSARALALGFTHVSYEALPQAVAPAAPLAAPNTYFEGLLDAEGGFHEGPLRVPVYARAWLMLLHFAYESLGFVSAAPTAPTAPPEEARKALFQEIDTVRAVLADDRRRIEAVKHLRSVLHPWFNTTTLSTNEDVATFWDELARYMQALLAAFAREALWQRDMAGLGEFIAGLS